MAERSAEVRPASLGRRDVLFPQHQCDSAELLAFLLKIDDLKHVQRETPTADGRRRECTAEHCWHLAMAALLFIDHATESIDVKRAFILALVHDLPEALVGDTFVFGSAESSRRSREEPALIELTELLPPRKAHDIASAWEEFEYRRSPEARYVAAIDVLFPVFLNYSGNSRSSWLRHDVTAGRVRANIESVRSALPALAELADQTIDSALRCAYLRS